VTGEAAVPVVEAAHVAPAARRMLGDPDAQLLDRTLSALPHVGIIDATGGLQTLGPERARSSEAMFGRPVDAILATWILLAETYLELVDEARAPAAELGRA
jgi:hypothetical protein